jgi:hypothetical protein
MEDNYLWNRSGEPDPDVMELEETLGSLKYQPRPLQIPANIRIAPQRRFFPSLAIAASLILFAAAGLWFYFHQRQTASRADRQESPRAVPQPAEATPVDKVATFDRPRIPILDRPRPKMGQGLLIANKIRSVRREPRVPQLTPEELAEKEQVLVALRLVSAKLNLAQRKTQSAPQANIIRNQHKVG